VLRHEEVSIDYRKPGETKPTPRTCGPTIWRIGRILGIVGHDVERGALRTFALPRIGAVTELKLVSAAGRSSPGLRAPSACWATAITAGVILFDATVAERVREREWHESQEMKELSGGRLELRLHLGASVEVEQWVLGWGAAAEVVGPAELRASVRQTVAALARRYTSSAVVPVSSKAFGSSASAQSVAADFPDPAPDAPRQFRRVASP